MRTSVPILAVLLLASACGGAEPTPTPTATANVRLAAVPGRPAAGYFELRIDGDRGALLSVASPQAGRIEMHETMTRGTMTSMRPIERIPVRDGDRLDFRPGGRHLMLYDLDPAVRPGGEIVLILNFERGPPRRLSAPATAAGGEIR